MDECCGEMGRAADVTKYGSHSAERFASHFLLFVGCLRS